uniref:Uncharacterized protein n=1 Tax=Strombidium rassoulzadegani TaxID=1082188 RepID=A0A7S3CRY2_9SPIT|mmetsp:Transcript_6119/g.10386  ORF Transcript_6119/g.10386 Transcript_6119/m.10386 type:complete len:149 (+) Transcript_6119:205-651(+)|eukprot:CAMPEP_0168615086 /NCGR_PEP_ID=MMETSP0449_2-20121227/4319_1 /TAXON_ID=1082188 /ORGANISM="Strombidium rassoulzadegani, Strain ras09" /LENGTH=148 /DNA_ID=CAMNT_0008655807 /DNA_START=172 /DNA_END=618 /DNA_ORIENTATION=+
MIQTLLEFGADSNVQENEEIGFNTALHRATEKNMLDVVKMLLDNGGDSSIQNKNGFTCLHIAARLGYLDMCKLLVTEGLDPNIRDKYGFSAAYWAKENKHKSIMEFLPNPLRVSKEEFYENMKDCWAAAGTKPGGGKKKKKKGGKKKK